MNAKKKSIRLILLFVFWVYSLSALGYYLWFEVSEVAAFIPILAPVSGYFVVFPFLNTEDKIKFRVFSWREIFIAVAIPFIYSMFAIVIGALISQDEIALNQLSTGFIAMLFFQWIFAGICEEIGWRGLLLPELSKHMSKSLSCILCGIIWGGWHIPMIVAGTMMNFYSPGIAIIIFMFETVLITVLMDVLNGKSIWRFVAFHAAHNIFVQIGVKIFIGEGKKLVDDGGIVLISCIFIMVLFTTFQKVYPVSSAPRRS